MSEGYILNTLQTPRLLRPVYEAVRDGQATADEIAEKTGLDRNAISQATNSLRYLRLLGKEDGELYAAGMKWERGGADMEFKLTLLHNLATECTPGNWGKQAVVLLNYEYLLEENLQYFSSNDQVLYDSINEWHRETKQYVPRSQQGPIDLNKNKFVNWSRIARYLGLVNKAKGSNYTVYPSAKLVYESIDLAIEERGRDNRVGIREYINWLDAELLPVSLSGDNSVPAPLARILFNLVRDGHIRFVEYGDAGAVSLADTPGRAGIVADANTIEVNLR